MMNQTMGKHKIVQEFEMGTGIARHTTTRKGIEIEFIPYENKKESGIIERLEEQVRDLQSRVEKLEKIEQDSMKGRLF